MSIKFLLFFSSTFLIVLSSFGIAQPLPDESTEKVVDTTLKSEIWDGAGRPSDKLLLYVLITYSKVTDTALKTGKKLLQDVIADVSTLNDKNEYITAKLAEYSELVSEIDKLQTEGDSNTYVDKIELMVNLGVLLNKSNVTLIEKPTSTDQLFEKSLQKNGLSDLDQHIQDKFDEVFSKEFYKTTQRILNSATTEEWPEKTRIQDWLKKFNMEDDVEKKSELFNELLDIFSSD